jgi:3D-(3,5/4)-trihydroxycyclohexane-1,2-dione acylhydrolase (decyclizing)
VWLAACQAKKREWEGFKALRYGCPNLYDDVWRAHVLSQPTAIKVVTDMARKRDVVAFFDAGDVQANGFQVVEDDRLGRTFTETGASWVEIIPCCHWIWARQGTGTQSPCSKRCW